MKKLKKFQRKNHHLLPAASIEKKDPTNGIALPHAQLAREGLQYE